MGKTGRMGAVIVVAKMYLHFISSRLFTRHRLLPAHPLDWDSTVFAGIVMVPTYSAKENPVKRSHSLFTGFLFSYNFPARISSVIPS